MNKVNYFKRGFLNRERGMAAFQCSVDAEYPDKHPYVTADFTISDCNRQVSLDFSCYSDEECVDVLSKVNLLQMELSKFAMQLVEAQGLLKKAIAENKEKDKDGE